MLKNRYFAMRHGQSEANVQGIIVSDASTGCAEYGLSAHGKDQVEQSLLTNHGFGMETVIVSSDFRRAQETARMAHGYLQCTADVVLNSALRERFFGDFNLGSDDQYETIWKVDAADAAHTQWNVESVNSVGERAIHLIRELEQKYEDGDILLVAHGDVLQILQTAFANRPLGTHRSMPHLNTAEIRRIHYEAR